MAVGVEQNLLGRVPELQVQLVLCLQLGQELVN